MIQNALKHSTIFFSCKLFFSLAVRLLLMLVFHFGGGSQRIFLSIIHSFLLRKLISEALMGTVLVEGQVCPPW